ncbi:MAG: DUF6106 family protein [Eubacteriales bacterium]
MSDMYKEFMVKREKSTIATIGKVVLIVIATLGFLSANLIGYILAAVLGVGAYLLHLNGDLEYEYLYLDRELTVDKIMAKTKRKRVESYQLDQMEIVAPIGSYQLDRFKNKDSTCKVYDYTSKEKNSSNTTYVIYYKNNQKILIEANEDFMKAMHNNAPRTVFVH